MAGSSIVFTDNLDEVLDAIDSAITAGLVEIGATAQGYAKSLTPVRTGTLRNGIGVEVKKDEKAAYIGTNVEYAPYVELGARGRAGKHMLQRAASEHGPEYMQIMEDAMANA